ncbi:16S rRNA (cytidine(1402)-2'-O)-methyltransferase [Paenibacillus sp. chi10]|uniref:Ribosomal RNA small subunit methyltransferase I n=1 Tax=Paenibacillus suaedae TaxID=3077233 RepID=A0AAJ2K171_9BACL|nr:MULTISPECIES: 16S rRNA (cytidine(1402)-2'-O)-methyltransferase [unclassified Paenibacillus]MDT8980201.1 16S rRNA (cytidine(1402)-2'-O)-methyltransferase [Paenibacillus sp. chi10]GAV15971.1 ribosomal RNA small subunit methyltransferase I [Paenibacillus sp. NAIST15-1]
MQLTEQYSYQQQNKENVGALYLVGTPIGNLEDMTFRAVRILREADIIAAEDTRETRKLLSHFEITGKTLYSYHEHNKQASGPELVRIMEEGKRIALVSDAGLPAISDPGADLVQLAVEAGIPVIPIPGPNAALSALIASGLPTNRFTFVGFLPREKKHADAVLASLRMEAGTLLFYESPHRIAKTLDRLASAYGDSRRITIARELTKRYEHFIRGTVGECIDFVSENPPLGECCIVVEGADENGTSQDAGQAWWQELTEEEHVAHYEREQGVSRKDAMKLAAKDRGVSKRDIYQALL